MDKKTKKNKIVKRLLYITISFFILFLIIISVLLNFIFTPEKVTPVVLGVLNENLDGKVECTSVELTFFSTFPNFGAKMNNGNIYSGKENQDTIGSFKECKIALNVVKLLRANEIDVRRVSLIQPNLRILTKKDGKLNWDILKKENTIDVQTDTAKFHVDFNSMKVKKLVIKEASISYQDMVSKLAIAIPKLNLNLSASDDKKQTVFKVDCTTEQMAVGSDIYKVVKDLKTYLKTDLVLNKTTRELKLSDTKLELNDIAFDLEGDFKKVPKEKKVSVNLKAFLKVPSLETLWLALPRKYLNIEDVDIDGLAQLELSTTGFWGSGSLPVSKGILKIEKGKVAYKKSSGTINLLEADINWLVDLKAKEKTQIDIHKLIVQGTGIQLNAKADVKRILTAPQITADLQSDIDLTQLKKAFPVSTNYHFEGKAVLDAKTNLNYDLAKNEVDYKNIILSGKCFLNNLKFKAPKDTISIDIQKTEIEVDKNQMESFVAHLDVEQLNLNYKDFHQIHSKKMKADLARGKKVGSKYPIDVNLAIEQLNYSSKDSIGGEVENTNLLLKVIPGKGEESSIFSAALASQKLKARQKDKKIFIEDGNYTFSVQKDKIKDKDWYPKGSIAFNKLVAIIPELGIPCLVKKTRVNFEDRNITLDNAFVALGKSKMRLSGNINNVFPRDKKDTTLYASLSVRSRYIDANQLMSAMHNNTAAVNNLEKVTEEKLDSEKTVTQKSVFKIPANINFSLDTSVDKLAFGDLEFSNIKGDVSIKESQLNLSNLSLKLNEAELQTKFKYKPVDETSAKIFYSMSIHNIEMEQIKDMVPVIDTLLPVAKTLEGKADFVIKGMMTINESMEPVIKTVKSIAALKAQNLKITESEAFKELAKTFMFKDKSNATIDNLEVEMLIEDSHLEILPALVEVDRYQLAIGGIQNVDLSYNYHISVLKSQIPFKTGVDVKGIIPNYDISLSKAKYKYYFTDKERLQSKADSTLIKKKAFIQDKIKF